VISPKKGAKNDQANNKGQIQNTTARNPIREKLCQRISTLCTIGENSIL